MSRVDEIKRQAVRLIADKGFEAMSLRQLAAAVGMQSGSIYTHYQSKGQLLLDLYCDYLEDLMSVWLERRTRHRHGMQKKLLSFVAVYVGFCHTRVEESRIVQLDFRSLDEQGKAQVSALRAQYEAELESILRQGMLAGVFQFCDLQVLQLAILSVMQGFCAVGCAAGPGAEARTFDACAAIILRLVGAERLMQFKSAVQPKPSVAAVRESLLVAGRAATAKGAVSPPG
jgi:AcrR family transcriptional regulator